jgi:hypothetical protein
MAKQTPFRTRQEVNRYFSGKTIKCLICGKGFGRLSFHLAAKHGITTDAYKSRFGLPWTRGLTSAQSHVNSGWTKARKAKARKLARKSKFFKYAHPAPRRQAPAFLKMETQQNLGPNSEGFGKPFASLVRTLFLQGLPDGAIAKALDVHRMTVNRRTRYWRKNGGRRKRVVDRAAYYAKGLSTRPTAR